MTSSRWGVLLELFPQLRQGSWRPYIYESDVIALDNGASKTQPVTIQLVDKRPFIWVAGLYKCDDAGVMAGGDTVFGGFQIKFDEAGGFGQAGKQSVMLDGLFGRGGALGEPREIPWPVLLDGASVISGEVKNLTGVAVNLRLDFIGIKQY